VNAFTRRGATAVAALAACAVAGIGTAAAYWSAGTVTTTATATAATLKTPATPAVASTSATSLTVSGSLPTGQLPGTAYTLKRGTTTICQPTSSPWSCTDTGLTQGTAYSYTLTAALGSWTATSAPGTGSTQCATAPVFVVSTSTATPTVGTPFSITITRRACDGSTDTSFTGSQPVTITGLSTSPSGKAPQVPSTVTFTAGVATGVNLTAYTAETTAVTVTQGQVTGRSAAITVQQAPAYSLRLDQVIHSSNNTPNTPVALSCTDGSGGNEAPKSCTQTTPTLSGNDKAWGGTIVLVDQWGNVRTNTGAPISITVANSAAGQPTSTVVIPTGQSSASFSFKGLPNGSGTSTVTITSTSPPLNLTIDGVG
jgi:hypothetical protein